MPRTGRPAARQVTAVHRAAAILDALAGGGGELGTLQIAQRTGINVSSVSRLLSTLTSTGLVAFSETTGRYRLGVHLLRLASSAQESLDIRALARPHLEALAEGTGETATLSIPGDTEAITVDFVQSSQSVRSVAQVGRPSLIHATAVGKVVLAYGGRLPDGPLPACTARTIISRRELRAEAARTRERGWAMAAGEREPDLNAIAAPVLTRSGRLAAVLGVQGPASRFGHRAMDAVVGLLLERARRVAAAL
jgi:DNA-binding IclR family transcriptional regulator